MYIIFEGANKVGKSTQIPLIKEKLLELFNKYGKYICINSFHEGDSVTEYENKTEAILKYALDRLSTQSKIYGTDSRNITLADRSIYSSLVYNSTDKQDELYIRTVNKFAKEPDYIIYLTNHQNEELDKRYREVLPIGKTIIFGTDEFTIEETTESLTEEIFIEWVMRYQKKSFDEAYDIVGNLTNGE